MNPRFNAIRLILVSALLLAAIFASLHRRSTGESESGISAIREAERIFEIREMTAHQRIGGRTGLWILGNRLDELRKGLNPPPSDRDWFETLRALFISGKSAALRPEVLEFLLETSVERAARIPPSDGSLLELACAQIERLPVPTPESPARKKLKDLSHQQDALPPLKWMAFRKLVAQDPSPEPASLEALIQILKKTAPPSEALALIEDVRNPAVRKSLARTVSTALKGYANPGKGMAVKTLAKNIAMIPEDYKRIRSISASLIKSNSSDDIETGLRAMTSILEFRKLDATEAVKLRGWLKSIPEEKSNPSIRGRVKVLLVKIGGETD
jgi:hypothetical protein